MLRSLQSRETAMMEEAELAPFVRLEEAIPGDGDEQDWNEKASKKKQGFRRGSRAALVLFGAAVLIFWHSHLCFENAAAGILTRDETLPTLLSRNDCECNDGGSNLCLLAGKPALSPSRARTVCLWLV